MVSLDGREYRSWLVNDSNGGNTITLYLLSEVLNIFTVEIFKTFGKRNKKNCFTFLLNSMEESEQRTYNNKRS